MKHSKTSKSERLKDPTHAWLLGLWNQWFALNKDRFHYPLVCKQAGGYKLIMGFQGLHPGLTFEISMDGCNNGIYFSWDGENVFYKNDPTFNPYIDCFLFIYQNVAKKYKNTIFWHKKCLKNRETSYF